MPGGPLGIIPTFMTTPADLEMAMTTVTTFYETVDADLMDADLMVVDDCSPDPLLVEALEAILAEHNGTLHRKEENTGFSQTVNVGLERALEEGRDAVLINSDIEFHEEGWLPRMMAVKSEDGSQDAAIVGALLLYPNGLIQHAGIYFSILHRWFDHIYRHAPQNLPEAQESRTCPVTGALQFIRLETMQRIGIYDPHFKLGWEDVDYCLRAWEEGLACVYEPKVRAYHHESVFRGRGDEKLRVWGAQSWSYWCAKWGHKDLLEFVPSVL